MLLGDGDKKINWNMYQATENGMHAIINTFISNTWLKLANSETKYWELSSKIFAKWLHFSDPAWYLMSSFSNLLSCLALAAQLDIISDVWL